MLDDGEYNWEIILRLFYFILLSRNVHENDAFLVTFDLYPL